MITPLSYMYVTSSYGNRIHPLTGEVDFHNGIDLRGDVGTPIYAPADGVIDSIFNNETGGRQTIIQHDNGYRTGYAHMYVRRFGTGYRVSMGEDIGSVGDSGAVTGPHLHFTMKGPDGEYVDPEYYEYDGTVEDLDKIIRKGKFMNVLPWLLIGGAAVTIAVVNTRRGEKT